MIKNIVSLDDPLLYSLLACMLFVGVSFLVSLTTKNVSHLDRNWSFPVMFYFGVFAWKDYKALISNLYYSTGHLVDFRILTMFGFVLCWGIRLFWKIK